MVHISAPALAWVMQHGEALLVSEAWEPGVMQVDAEQLLSTFLYPRAHAPLATAGC